MNSLYGLIEFTTMSFIVILTYLGIHTLTKKVKPITRFLISMFLGIFGYVIAKSLIILFMNGM